MPTRKDTQDHEASLFDREVIALSSAWDKTCRAWIRASKDKAERRSLKARQSFVPQFLGFLMLGAGNEEGRERVRNFLALQSGERPARYGVTLIGGSPVEFEIFINEKRDFDFFDAREIVFYSCVRIRKLDGQVWPHEEAADLVERIQEDLEFDGLICAPEWETTAAFLDVILWITEEDWPAEEDPA